MKYEDEVKTDVVLEIARSVLYTIADVLKMHGPDPENEAIVVAGLSVAITTIGNDFPHFPQLVMRQIGNGKTKR